MSRIAVLGDGAWGSALASLARECEHNVSVWSRKQPDRQGVVNANATILALPAQVIGSVLQSLSISPGTALIIAAKGIDRATHRFMHEVVRSVCANNPVLILSGPSFADDVTHKLPTAVTLAAETLDVAEHWAKLLSRPHFRIYASDDLVGVALGGSLKNVLAIASGISDGKQLGASARAALIARGFSELSRLGRKLGAKPETLMGLSGLGDLLLTCSSPQSRNYAFGRRLGEGLNVREAIAVSNGVVEGVYSAQAALALAHRSKLVMPITKAVYEIVENNANPDEMIKALLARPVGAEFV
jgi:glycerol-3-phosphate dehydrogenase (NAD(P)+)